MLQGDITNIKVHQRLGLSPQTPASWIHYLWKSPAKSPGYAPECYKPTTVCHIIAMGADNLSKYYTFPRITVKSRVFYKTLLGAIASVKAKLPKGCCVLLLHRGCFITPIDMVE